MGTLFTLYVIPAAYTVFTRKAAQPAPTGGPVPAKAASAPEE
jgi:hypothetical protein